MITGSQFFLSFSIIHHSLSIYLRVICDWVIVFLNNNLITNDHFFLPSLQLDIGHTTQ